MLRLTLNKDDYITIGDDITLEYSRNTGKGRTSIAISAPRDLKILRKSIYESAINEMAEQGDEEAKIVAERLKEEQKERKRISEYRLAEQKRQRELAKKKKAAKTN